MQPDSNRELNDQALADEIRLLGDLMLAVSRGTGPLTQDELDQILNPGPSTGQPLPPTGEPLPPTGEAVPPTADQLPAGSTARADGRGSADR